MHNPRLIAVAVAAAALVAIAAFSGARGSTEHMCPYGRAPGGRRCRTEPPMDPYYYADDTTDTAAADVDTAAPGDTSLSSPSPSPAVAGAVAPQSPHAGALLVDLPIDDLRKPGGGAWKVKQRQIEWKKSSIVTFEGRSALRVVYQKGSGTSRHKGGVGGIGFDAAPSVLPADSAVMAFDVYFEPGWDFSHGGKLTGWHLGFGNASGGRHSADAASCRLSFFDKGSAHCYIYVPSGLAQVDPRLKGSGSGNKFFLKELFTPGTFKVGQWNHVELGVKLNTFDAAGKPNADGHAMLHINGKTGIKKDIRWARKPENNLKYYVISSFFGGSEPAVVDCALMLRDFRVYAWK